MRRTSGGSPTGSFPAGGAYGLAEERSALSPRRSPRPRHAAKLERRPLKTEAAHCRGVAPIGWNARLGIVPVVLLPARLKRQVDAKLERVLIAEWSGRQRQQQSKDGEHSHAPSLPPPQRGRGPPRPAEECSASLGVHAPGDRIK